MHLKKYILIFALSLIVLSLKAQSSYFSNLAYAKTIDSDKAIYSTFTDGIVNYVADVRLIYGELYLTRNMPETAEHNLPTLRSGIMMPLYSQFKKHNNSIHSDFSDEIFLFIDVSTDFKRTYFKLWDQLLPYKELLSYREGAEWHKGSVKIVFVGKISEEIIENESVGLITVEGTLADLEANYSSQYMPVIGIDFSSHINWDGFGNMDFNEFTALKAIVKKVHSQNKKVRVYNCPDKENVYEVMLTSGIDFITTSNPELLKSIIKQQN